MFHKERRIGSEIFQRERVVESFLTELSTSGFRFGIVEDKGIITNAVTVAGSTKAFDYASITPRPQERSQDVARMASSALSRLNGNSALAGNLGIGITHNPSSQLTYCAYASEGKQTKIYSFTDTDNENYELAFVLQGAQSFIRNETFVPYVFAFQENIPRNEEEVKNLIKEVTKFAETQNWSITTSESCTGGYLAKQFAANQGSAFVGGVTLYNEQQKIKEGISTEQLSHGNVYSQEVALAMARAACRNYAANISIATTGVMENPDTRPFHEHVTPGTVYYAFIICGKPFSGELQLSLNNSNGSKKTREELKQEASNIILRSLLKCMVESATLFSKYSPQE